MDIGDLFIKVLEALEAGSGPGAFQLLRAQALKFLGKELPDHLKDLLDWWEAHEANRLASVQEQIDRLQGHVRPTNKGGAA